VYQPRYVAASNAFRVMLLASMVQLVFAWTKSFPVSIGRPGLRTAGQVLEIAVLVPAVLLLARSYGATGAALGVLAGAVVLASFWALRLVELRRQLA
jgi:O-antigen/teichoic acid export membrane protein